MENNMYVFEELKDSMLKTKEDVLKVVEHQNKMIKVLQLSGEGDYFKTEIDSLTNTVDNYLEQLKTLDFKIEKVNELLDYYYKAEDKSIVETIATYITLIFGIVKPNNVKEKKED